MINQSEPTVSVSMSKKINMGNYESADAFVSVSGIKAGMTAEEIRPLLDTAKIAWGEVATALAHQITSMRSE